MKRVNFPLIAATALTIFTFSQAFAEDAEMPYSENAMGTNQNIDPSSPFVSWEVIRNRPSNMPDECVKHDCVLSYGIGKLQDKVAIWTITLPRSAGRPADCKFTFCYSESAFSSDRDLINYDTRKTFTLRVDNSLLDGSEVEQSTITIR